MELFGHPFSSYTWKALIAFYELGISFELRSLEDPAAGAEFGALWPIGKFPLLRDGDQVIPEATSIIEHLSLAHPGLIPADPRAAATVRHVDRLFDNYIMTPMQRIVGDALRPADAHDPTGVADARALLTKSYAWLDAALPAEGWAAGDFSLADCAAAPSLFYADWVRPIPDENATLKAYRARLLARPSVARAVDEARPYRRLFPLGAPDRD